MPTQPETLVVTLPAELAAKIRAQVHSGQFTSENDVILHDLAEAHRWDDLPDEPLGPPMEEWIEKELPATLARLDSGEEETYTIDEVRSHLEEWKREALGG
jgi:hypothetical protein